MKNNIEIHWNGFIKQCCKNYPNESCAFLFAKKPFNINEEWFVFPIDNVAKDKNIQWQPDIKQLRKTKKKAKELKLICIGNIHSHPLPDVFPTREENIDDAKYPSKDDLKYAQKFNDIIRGILVVDNEAVYAHTFHDMFGNIIDIYLEEMNVRPLELDLINHVSLEGFDKYECK